MQQITLDSHETIVIPMMQGDNDYQISVKPIENLTGKISSVDVDTISGNILSISTEDTTVDETNNTITFTVDAQTTAIAGNYKAQIKIYKKAEPTKLVSYYPIILQVASGVKPISSPYETAIAKVDDLIANGYKLAESWAHGGTNTRDGEDTDNAKYYADQAKTAYEDISDTNEAKLSNRISAIESGYTINQVYLGTIQHDLNKYPTLDGYSGAYGAGITAGSVAGGSSLKHVTLYWTCTDKNIVRIYADKHVLYDDNGTQMTVDKIEATNEIGHYVVTFKNSTHSMQIIMV